VLLAAFALVLAWPQGEAKRWPRIRGEGPWRPLTDPSGGRAELVRGDGSVRRSMRIAGCSRDRKIGGLWLHWPFSEADARAGRVRLACSVCRLTAALPPTAAWEVDPARETT
jgi:hypothetical protein